MSKKTKKSNVSGSAPDASRGKEEEARRYYKLNNTRALFFLLFLFVLGFALKIMGTSVGRWDGAGGGAGVGSAQAWRPPGRRSFRCYSRRSLCRVPGREGG